jgi:CDGSH iron-sulfur domain-containing protein 3|uniref:CDGSH iron-sulfur domain-containing protein n=1 Tax=Cephaloticoccus sp. TaxID=1985742 RepID=UPI00404B23D1
MSTPHIAQKSPYVKKMPAGTYWWCACGLSKDQPLCDGSHKGSGFAPKKVEFTEEKTVAWCGCKNSANGAHCDGSHKNL